MPLASWEQARTCLKAILSTEPPVVSISHIKRLFRCRFGFELSETALGHSKLQELFQDFRFSDICSVELQGTVPVLVQKPPPGLWDAEYWMNNKVSDQQFLATSNGSIDQHICRQRCVEDCAAPTPACQPPNLNEKTHHAINFGAQPDAANTL